MKRFTKFLLYTLLIISFSKITVKAAVNHGYNQSFQNNCVEQKTCMLLCAYTNTVQYTAKNVIPVGYNYYSSYIYYDFNNGSFFIDWLSQETNIEQARHSNYWGHSTIFFGNSVKDNLWQGKCPTNSFIDVDGLGLVSEVCFDNGDNYCINASKGNPGTAFKGESTLEYNYQNHVSNYFNAWFPNLDYSCEEYRNLDINIKDNFINDFSKNFLYEYSIPSFLEKSYSYQDGLKEIDNRIVNLKSKCDREVENDYRNGKITDVEKELQLEKNNEASDNLENQISEATREMAIGKINVSKIEPQDCESLFGSPTDSKDPAYYLSFAFRVIRYIAIIILIVLSSLDFISAVASHDDDELKKAMNKTIKRLVLCIVIFLLPTLLEFILKIINDNSITKCIKN